jgi:hypothetical protein
MAMEMIELTEVNSIEEKMVDVKFRASEMIDNGLGFRRDS